MGYWRARKWRQFKLLASLMALAYAVLFFSGAFTRLPLPTHDADANSSAEVRDSQTRAVNRHPPLGALDSDFNLRFRTRLEEWKTRSDTRLTHSDWPEVLADNVAANP